MAWLRFSVVIVVLLLLARVVCAEPKSVEFHDGRWQQVETPATLPATDANLDRVEQLLKDEQPKAARKLLLWWIRTYPASPQRDRGVFLLAHVYYQLDNRILAFYHLDEVMDTWPDGKLFTPALEKQFEIADQFLGGYKESLLGAHILDRYEEAIQMMFRIQQRAPGSPVAEKALLRTADFYYASQDFDLAGDAYSAYARAYPRSPFLPKVRLREAFSSLAQFRGTKWDATAMIDARAQLVDLMSEYPDLSREENLPEWIENIDRTFAKKITETADFYFRTHEPDGARYMLNYLARTYPNTPEGKTAIKELQKHQ